MKTDGALPIALGLGLLMAYLDGKGNYALLWIILMFVGTPIFYTLVVSRSSVSEIAKWLLTAAYIFGVTALFI